MSVGSSVTGGSSMMGGSSSTGSSVTGGSSSAGGSSMTGGSSSTGGSSVTGGSAGDSSWSTYPPPASSGKGGSAYDLFNFIINILFLCHIINRKCRQLQWQQSLFF
ncbi:hypothetical protein F7731_23540 [Cytobacillus depressus]|uniref:Uncharacterized protein n=1 Tax=Cytobacillus depressus TaxID=1602942 RepID=A0A6L3UY30_9BACI|nr:hypothetical protein F7731_23540 [Cytobacillus depressus]